MDAVNGFDAFCEAQALQQQRNGFDVPSSQSQSFSYYQWLEVARERYTQSQSDTSQSGAPPLVAAKVERGNELADAIALQLAASLQTYQKRPTTAPASLRHAAQESFPTPSPDANKPAYLALSEAAVRLTLWHHDDARLAYVGARLRPNLRSLEDRGVLRIQEGCYPALQLLVDLLSWRIIVHRWDRLSPAMRRTAVSAVDDLCSCVRSPAARTFMDAVSQLDVSSSTTSVPVARLDSLAAEVSASIPFQFDACRDLVTIYPEPTGVLCVPTVSPLLILPSAAVGDAGPSSFSPSPSPPLPPTRRGVDRASVASDGDVTLADLLDVPGAEAAAPTSSRKRVRSLSPVQARTSTKSPRVAAPLVADGVPQAPRGRAPAATTATTAPAAASSGRRPTVPATVNGHPACTSRYHRRYADASRHASSECQYCATCHLMEIVFHAEKTNCFWKHWPTPRKIRLHLKRFPTVMTLALKRLGEMEKGVQLAATHDVPL